MNGIGTFSDEWELVNFKSSKSRPSKYVNTVWFSCSGTKSKIPNTLNISSDLVAKLNWTAGTRVNLYKSTGGNMFMLKENKVGLITLRKKKGSNVLMCSNANMVLNFDLKLNGVEFDAWIDGSSLVFRSKKM